MRLNRVGYPLLYTFAFVVLYFIQLENFNFFHTLAETYTVIVALFVFFIIIYFKKGEKDNFLTILAVSYLSTSFLDFLHMFFFSSTLSLTTNQSISFWVAGRYVESLSLIIAALYMKRKSNLTLLSIIYLTAVVIITFGVIEGYFPVCFNKEIGLTPFKIYSEYIIILFFIIAMLLFRRKSTFSSETSGYIYLHIIFMVLGELLFTLYSKPSSFVIFIGHIFKIVAYYYLYKAVVITVIRQPLGFFFGNLLRHYESLHEQEKYNQILLDSINSYLLILRTNGQVVNVNHKVLKLLGVNEEDFLNKFFWQTILVEDAKKEKTKKLFLENIKLHKTLVFDLRVDINNRVRFFSWVFNYTNYNGNERLIICSGKDITELRKKSFYLDRSSNIIEHLPVMVVITDEKENIEYVNPEFERISGYERGDVVGHKVKMLKSDERVHSSSAQMWRELKENRVWKGTFYNRKKNGDEYTVKNTLFSLKNQYGKKYYVAIQEDITNKLKIKEVLFEKSQILDTIFNTVPAMIWLKDLSNIILKVNKQASSYVNLSQTEIEGKSAYDIYPELERKYLEDDKKIVQTKQASLNNVEISYTHDNIQKWLNIDKIPILDDNHNVTGIIVFAVDITKQKELERILRSKEAYAIRQNRDKSKFLSNISHELKTPMNTVLGYAQVLYNEQALQSDKHNVMIGSILSSGYYLMNLIGELLDLAHIENGKVEVNRSKFDLKEFFEALYNIFLLQVNKDNITIFFEGIPDKATYVYSDRQKLYNILSNLISNAIKFTSKGGITVFVSYSEDSLKIIVSDTGCGIDKNTIDKIYSPFYQTDIGKTSGGLGLGLAIVKEYVHLLEGDIAVESEVNKGTSFTLNFPLEGGTIEKEKTTLFSVLILDDVTKLLDDVYRKLKELGVDVTVIQNTADNFERILEYILYNNCTLFVNYDYQSDFANNTIQKILSISPKLNIYLFSGSKNENCFGKDKNISYVDFNISIGELFEIIYRYNDYKYIKIKESALEEPLYIKDSISDSLIDEIITSASEGDKTTLKNIIERVDDIKIRNYILQLIYNFQFQKIIDYVTKFKESGK